MEAFSLLSAPENDVISDASAGSLSPYSSSSDNEEEEEEEDSYFDLQFAIPNEEEEEEEEEGKENGDETEEETELKFSLTSNNCTDENVTITPSIELSEEENSKFLVSSLLKSATNFRVLLLKLKKSKSEKSDELEETQKKNLGRGSSSKFLTVKLRAVEDIKLPLVSMFNNLDSNGVQKYLKMVKPFYVRVSKRYVEKMKGGAGVSERSSEVVEPATVTENVKSYQKKGSNSNNNLQMGLRVVRKHLGKSKSASAVVVAADPTGKVAEAASRRDDSLLQVQDGIQGAILHCKRSFNASRDPI